MNSVQRLQMLLEAIGLVLKTARERKGYSQKGLAKRLAHSSVTRLKLIECGEAGNLTLKTLVKLAGPLFPNMSSFFGQVVDQLEDREKLGKVVKFVSCRIIEFSDGTVAIEIPESVLSKGTQL